MPFLRFNAQGHEWGFDVPDGFIPAVGDKVSLWHAPPDEEADDCIDGLIVARRWSFASDFAEWLDIDFEVELESSVPDGHVADSTEWPSETHSERRKECEKDVERIIADGSPLPTEGSKE
jgi:hypothetical protein